VCTNGAIVSIVSIYIKKTKMPCKPYIFSNAPFAPLYPWVFYTPHLLGEKGAYGKFFWGRKKHIPPIYIQKIVETVDPRESLKIKGSRAWVHVVLEVVDPREGLIFLGFRAWVFTVYGGSFLSFLRKVKKEGAGDLVLPLKD
jgi:hypothetical protein